MAEQKRAELIQAFDMQLADNAFKEIGEFGVRLQEQPAQTIWLKNILVCLLSALLREYRSLAVGVKKSTPLLAWACRNMLELNIYTKYILLNGSNAKDFVDDMWIDAIDIFSSFRAWITFHDPASMTPELDQTIANFLSEKAKQGITRTKYLRAQDKAAVVNFSEEYQYMNKVASKLVHPTAFSVLTPFDEGELGHLKPILFNAGVRFGVEAFTDIRQYIIKNRVEPLP
jgi:Family of unknown function (DUF5677)